MTRDRAAHVLAGAVLAVLTGCSQQKLETVNVWSSPQEVGKSSDSLSTSFSLYRWNGSLLALGGDAGTYAARLLQDDAKSWSTLSTRDPGWIPMDVHPHQNTFVVSRATIRNDGLDAQFVIGSLSPSTGFISNAESRLRLQRHEIFPDSKPNLRMTDDDKPARAMFAGGTLDDTEIRIPYSIVATPVQGKVIMAGQSVSANGVFCSTDGGRTWRAEPIAIRYSESPVVGRTRKFSYFFAKGGLGGSDPYELWFCRCAAGSSSWSSPETLNKTVARKLSEGLHAVGQNDTMHLCWLDARNDNTSFDFGFPHAGSYEVAYSRRKDSDAGWSKAIMLSKGLKWAYAPSMSVEGNNIVVAWAGAKSGKEGHNESNASDIYYAISKDSGNSWTKPIQVTDGYKAGVTSGRPQVAIRNGTIHLFYIQGKISYKQVSAGMVKLNQPPWPILYQQRPFPN